jgi:RNA polymerase sigma factor (sigma-70 family)
MLMNEASSHGEPCKTAGPAAFACEPTGAETADTEDLGRTSTANARCGDESEVRTLGPQRGRRYRQVPGKGSSVHRSDPELVKACQRGDQKAWRELVDRYGRLVYSIPRRYGLTESDSEDVVQAVFTALFRRLGNLRDLTRLSAWLITTAHRQCWHVGRRNDAQPELEERIVDVGSPGEDQIETWERQHLVRLALEQLGGPCKELLTALFLEPSQSDYQAVAERLGMKLGSIGPTRTRCFRKLQKILLDLGYEGAPQTPAHAD